MDTIMYIQFDIIPVDKEMDHMKSFLLLDRKIAKEFHRYAEQTTEYPNNYGEMTRLRIVLQKLCGITELEAINVLIDRNVSDYISKYNGYFKGYYLEDKVCE